MTGCSAHKNMAGSDELPPFSFCHPAEHPRKKPQNLNFSDGFREVRDPDKRTQDRLAISESMKDYYHDLSSCGPCNTGIAMPKWLKYDRQVLRFFCYFKEPVHERREENFRVRKCTLYFYLEDGSMYILEPREQNSGILQGSFLKRHKFPKPGGGYFTVADFQLGSDITIYNRTFRICNCDTFTKRYLLKHRFELGKEEDVPGEPLTAYRESLQRHRLKYHKDYANKQFLENDGKVLRFFCVWDDREAVYGDRRPYVLHYFLADDTIEIVEVHERNSGRPPFSMFLRRCRLPRDIPTDLLGKNIGATYPKSAFYNDSDLAVGSYISVYGRDLLLHDCDDFTRKYYRQKYGVTDDMLEPVEVQEPPPVLARMEVPPHNGFGADVDSLQNCISLIPKPYSKDLNQFLHHDGKVMAFSAILAEDETHKVPAPDKGRLFVFKYFLSDDTIGIWEPPIRNSGIVGGKFLSREDAPMKRGSKRPYRQEDMVVGAKIDVHNHLFDLLEADEWTLKYMENHPQRFPMSDPGLIIMKLTSEINKLPEDGVHHLKYDLPSSEVESKGKLKPFDLIIPILDRAGIKLTKQELVTLDRHVKRGLVPDAPTVQALIVNIAAKSIKN